MLRPKKRILRLANLLIPLVFCLVLACNADAQVATWTGGGDGVNYSDPANWNTEDVPIGSTFTVIVPDGHTINFDVTGSVAGLSYGSGGKINVSNGVAYTVLGVAVVGSDIEAKGPETKFLAANSGATLGDGANLITESGGEIEYGTTNWEYSASSTQEKIVAKDAGSNVSMTSLQTLNKTGGGTSIFRASNLGTIDFSNMTSVNSSAGEVRFVTNGGTIKLDSLADVFGRTAFEVAEGNSLELKDLVSVTGVGNRFALEDSAQVTAEKLTQLDGTTLSVGSGAVFDARNVSSFQNSSVLFDAASTVNLGPLNNIDNSRISVIEGQVVDIGATSFTRSLTGSNVALRADGAGSKINAGSLESISNTSSIPPNFGNAPYVTSFIAENGGVLDLSGLRTLDGGSIGSFSRQTRNQFLIRTGGSINLNGLETIDQRNTFEILAPSLNLPSLTQAGGVSFLLDVGTVLNTPELTTMAGSHVSYLSLPAFASWNAGKLQSVQDTTLDLTAGSVVNASSLTSFTNSSLSLIAGVSFNSGQLTEIDNSRFSVSGGATLDLHADSFARSFSGSSTAMSAEGNNSTIDASKIKNIFNHVSLSQSIGVVYTTDFSANSGGVLDLSGVEQIDGGGTGSFGRATLNRFTAENGGKIIFGSVEATAFNRFIVGANGEIEAADLSLDGRSTLSVASSGTLKLTGSLSHSHTAEGNVDLESGTVIFSGSPDSELELTGENVGLSTDGLGNFGIHQLQVGQVDAPTTLTLVDRIDNGNRTNGASEVQYLLDPTNQGLIVNQGSRVILNGYDLMVSNGVNSFASIRDQFMDGEISVEYEFGGGLISLTGDFGEIYNGDFETRDLKGFRIIGPGMAGVQGSPRSGNVMEMTAGSPVEVMQFVSTLDSEYLIQLDALALDTSGTLSLILNGETLESWDYTELVGTDLQSISFLADDSSLWGLTDVSLSLHWDANTGDSVWIDNWRMTSTVPEPGSITLLAGFGLAICIRRRRRN